MQAPPAARRRFVYVAGALRPFPTSPPALFKTNLLRRARQAAPLASSRSSDGATTRTNRCSTSSRGVSGARRPSARPRPALIGVYRRRRGGAVGASGLPRLAALEREHGSVLRGMMCRTRGGRRAGASRLVSRRPRRAAAALAPALGSRRRVARAAAIAPIDRRGAAAGGPTADGAFDREPSGSCSRRPPPRPPRCSRPHAPEAAAALRADPPRARRRRLPRVSAPAPAWAWTSTRTGSSSRAAKACAVLGCQYESSVFPDRAPAGGVLLRALLRRHLRPAARRRATTRPSPAQVLGDLRRAAGLRRDPDFVDVWRARPGIPQYDRAHAARVASSTTRSRASPAWPSSGTPCAAWA